MPRNFLQHTFKSWLDKNRAEFHRRPIGVKYRNGGVDFTLQDTPNIRVYLRKYGAVVESTQHGKPMGLLTHIDMREFRFEGYYLNGYSVVTNDVNAQEYFIDRITLWELDVFNKLVVWVNEDLPTYMVA